MESKLECVQTTGNQGKIQVNISLKNLKPVTVSLTVR
nr:hypothetical protein [Mucilaginibacter sp. X4EP1]